MGSRKHFIPLESNPEVMTAFARNLGAEMEGFRFTDVWGLDPELLAMVERPVLAVILLFPISAQAGTDRQLGAPVQAGEGPYYMKQTIGNACGTIAVLHALLNNRTSVVPKPGSFLDRFFFTTRTMDAEGRGDFLEHPPDADLDIEACHKEAALAGSTTAPAATDDIDLHFVAFVHHNGQLFELDGRQRGPIEHGSTTPETLLEDAAEAIKAAHVAKSDSLNFSLIALAAD